MVHNGISEIRVVYRLILSRRNSVTKLVESKKLFKKVAWYTSVISAGTFCAITASYATGQTLGGVASSITSSFAQVTRLITGGSYLAGIAFSIGAIMKFKMHKDNPQQVPIGTPIALLFIAAALLFLPSVLGVAGSTIFGSATTSGPSGSIFK